MPMMRGPLMQALLENRFKLKIHRESRDVQVYELTQVRDGPKLKTAREGSCTTDDREPPFMPLPHIGACGLASLLTARVYASKAFSPGRNVGKTLGDQSG
jgi:uncharacterized protein (TIGR03435 family)